MTSVRSRKRHAAWLGSLACVAMFVSACGGGSAGGNAQAQTLKDMEPTELKVATFGGPDDVHSKPLQAFAEYVEEETDGKVTFEFFYGGSLVGATELASGLRDGTIDMATVFPAYTPADFPVDAWASPVAFMQDQSPILGSLQAIAANSQWGFETEEYLQGFEDYNIKPLIPRVQTAHQYNIACEGEVSTSEDLQGKRVRVGGEAHAADVTALGAVPVNLPMTEAYTSLQQGVIDCAAVTPSDLERNGLDELVDSYVFVPLTGWSSNAFGMSLNTWESLPVDVQQIIWDGLPSYLEAFANAEFDANLSFTELDLKFHPADDQMLSALETHREGVMRSRADDASAGLNDPAGTLDRYSELHDTWKSTLAEAGIDGESGNWNEYVQEHGSELPDVSSWVQLMKEQVLEPNRPQG